MTTDADVESVTDVLGEPYLAETIPLPPDDEGQVVATLVRRTAGGPTTKAVLHVHGFADYFFQTGYAEWWTERGYDFYALDLRKYGRSLRPHQTPNYVTDLRDYFAELDEAWTRVTERDGHDHVVISAHSTGGLIIALWADERQPAELAGAGAELALARPAGQPPLRRRRHPRSSSSSAPGSRCARSSAHVTGFYTRSLHLDHEGEWDFDLPWKPVESFTVYAGWLRAIREGHAELHRGLDVAVPGAGALVGALACPRRWATTCTAPTSCSTSPRSGAGRPRSARTSPTSRSRAPGTTSCSPAASRARAAYDAIRRWMTAWVTQPKQSLL